MVTLRAIYKMIVIVSMIGRACPNPESTNHTPKRSESPPNRVQRLMCIRLLIKPLRNTFPNQSVAGLCLPLESCSHCTLAAKGHRTRHIVVVAVGMPVGGSAAVGGSVLARSLGGHT